MPVVNSLYPGILRSTGTTVEDKGSKSHDETKPKSKSNLKTETEKKEVKSDKEDTFKQTVNFVKDYVNTPISGLSAGLGILSFIFPNFTSKGKIDWFDNLTNWSIKGAYFANSIFGLMTNSKDRDFVGTAAYGADFATAIVAPAEEMYLWRGFGSALDQGPLFMQVLNNNEKIQKKYNKDKKEGFKYTNFTGFGDSLSKLFFALKVSVVDTIDSFKKSHRKNGALKAMVETIKTRSDFNLLTTTIGVVTGSTLGVFFGFKDLGSKVRDVFGLLADFAVGHGGLQGNEGKGKSKGDILYQMSAVTYTLGTLTDFFYRFKPLENLHFAALGVDRLGSLFMSLGNHFHNEDANNKN